MNYKQNKANRQFKIRNAWSLYTSDANFKSSSIPGGLFVLCNTHLDVSKLLVKAILCSGKGSTLGSTGVVICPLSWPIPLPAEAGECNDSSKRSLLPSSAGNLGRKRSAASLKLSKRAVWSEGELNVRVAVNWRGSTTAPVTISTIIPVSVMSYAPYCPDSKSFAWILYGDKSSSFNVKPYEAQTFCNKEYCFPSWALYWECCEFTSCWPVSHSMPTVGDGVRYPFPETIILFVKSN